MIYALAKSFLMRTALRIVCVLILLSLASYAQSVKDTVSLKAVDIVSPRLHTYLTGAKVEMIDSTIRKLNATSTLADLLSRQSVVFIKTYGGGSLAMPSFRGGSAAHTSLLWNGIPIQSSVDALADLSLIPSLFFDEIKIQYGGSSALWGSGAIGGALHLNQKMEFNQGFSAVASVASGSFGFNQYGTKLKWSSKRFSNDTRWFTTSSPNSFSFTNSALLGNPTQSFTHAETHSWGIMQQNSIFLTEKQRLNVRLWYQENTRNVPPTMLQDQNEAFLINKNTRTALEYAFYGEKIRFYSRTGYLAEALTYNDSLAHIESVNKANRLIQEAEFFVPIRSNTSLNFGINETFISGGSEKHTMLDYLKKAEQNRLALFINYRWNNINKKYVFSFSGRQEFLKQTKVPFVPSFAFEYFPLRFLELRGTVSKNFRLPAFTDLYWAPGGNRDLLPENGWSEELTLGLKKSDSTFYSFHWNNTAFNRNIQNWIMWLPAGGFTSPKNIAEVWSRGVETEADLNLRPGNFKLRFSTKYSYVLSTNLRSKALNDNSIDKQLIFVPFGQGVFNVFILYKKITINYNEVFTGLRYTSSDNEDYLPGFWLSNAAASYDLTIKKLELTLALQVNNIRNTSYQTIPWMPMPGRNYLLNLSIKL